MARLPSLRLTRVPDAPTLPVRDLWPGDPTQGARLLKGELVVGNSVRALQPGGWGDSSGSPGTARSGAFLHVAAGFRALGTDAARQRARTLVSEWIATPQHDPVAIRPDVVGARIAAWLGHYDFFAASAEDAFRQKLMARLVGDARALSAAMPVEENEARGLTAIKGLVAAAVALPDQGSFLSRALRFLPQELTRQDVPDGSHIERSPATNLSALQDLTEIRALLQAAQATPPPALGPSIERLAAALRVLRHGDGGLALFNGAREETSSLVDLALTQAGRAGRAPTQLVDGGFHRLQAGRSVLLMDTGAPPPTGFDRNAHAGTLAFELSIGRDRLVVNCGSAPAAMSEWRDALRATAAHSTLIIDDTSSSELKPEGLGRRPEQVEVQRQEASGAHWLEASHDGWLKTFGALHRRRLYVAASGEDIRGEDAVESATPQSFAVPLSSASQCPGDAAARWRGRDAAAGRGRELAFQGRRRPHRDRGKRLYGRQRAPPRRADCPDLRGRGAAAGQMGNHQAGLAS